MLGELGVRPFPPPPPPPLPPDPSNGRGDEPARRHATFSVLAALFQWGWGLGAFGLHTATTVQVVPAGASSCQLLFGLSTDYQVFLISRMINEEWARSTSGTRHFFTGPTTGRADAHRAVRAGQDSKARVITAAATILICVFLAFSLVSQRSVAEFGISLTIAVALDAFVLGTVLVPAVMPCQALPAGCCPAGSPPATAPRHRAPRACPAAPGDAAPLAQPNA